jgi:hypothetical protein
VDWVGLDEFQSQTSQNLSQFFPIPSNPHEIGITEQALLWPGGLSSVPGIRKRSFGPVCVLDLINRLQTTSTHTGRLVSVVLPLLIYFFSLGAVWTA